MAQTQVKLSAEQKSFLEECEIEFSTRYTTDDEDYKTIYENDIPPPPIMIPWYGRQKLVARRRFGGNRYNSGYNNDYNNDYREQKDRDHYNSPRNQYNDRRHNRPY